MTGNESALTIFKNNLIPINTILYIWVNDKSPNWTQELREKIQMAKYHNTINKLYGHLIITNMNNTHFIHFVEYRNYFIADLMYTPTNGIGYAEIIICDYTSAGVV